MKKSSTSKAVKSSSSRKSAGKPVGERAAKPAKPGSWGEEAANRRAAVALIYADAEVAAAVLQLARAYELIESSTGRLIGAVDSALPPRNNSERSKAIDSLIEYAQESAALGKSTSAIVDPPLKSVAARGSK